MSYSTTISAHGPTLDILGRLSGADRGAWVSHLLASYPASTAAPWTPEPEGSQRLRLRLSPEAKKALDALDATTNSRHVAELVANAWSIGQALVEGVASLGVPVRDLVAAWRICHRLRPTTQHAMARAIAFAKAEPTWGEATPQDPLTATEEFIVLAMSLHEAFPVEGAFALLVHRSWPQGERA